MDYYEKNAELFLEKTIDVDMSKIYERFLKFLPEGGQILDAGCGSGRDSLAFMKKGYHVIAMDSSPKMCQLAGEYIGQSVFYCRFQDMDFKCRFDGIWACASLLHVPSHEFSCVLRRCAYHLKQDGIFYASFKYGEFEGERNGRHFLDLNEKSAEELFTNSGFKIKEMWITHDSRPDHVNEKWLNILVTKH